MKSVWIVLKLIYAWYFCFRFIIVVEHDLSVLDYLSDFICCLYGVPGAYGVVTMPFSVREGMYNIYTVIDGCNFLPFFLFLYSLSPFFLFVSCILSLSLFVLLCLLF